MTAQAQMQLNAKPTYENFEPKVCDEFVVIVAVVFIVVCVVCVVCVCVYVVCVYCMCGCVCGVCVCIKCRASFKGWGVWHSPPSLLQTLTPLNFNKSINKGLRYIVAPLTLINPYFTPSLIVS